jgi:hypothetical protein
MTESKTISIDRGMEYSQRAEIYPWCGSTMSSGFWRTGEVVLSVGEIMYLVVHFPLVGDKSWVLAAIF